MSAFWPYDTIVNPNRLATKILEEAQYENEFSYLTGENYRKVGQYVHRDESRLEFLQQTGAMIEEYQDLKSGGTELRIPVIRPIKGMPVAGDTPVGNTGEQATLVYQTATVNEIRKTYQLTTSMGKQTIGLPTAARIDQGANELKNWHTKFTDGDLYFTVLNGVSRSLTPLSGIPGAVNETPHSHGRFYVAGVGQISYAAGRPGTSGYEGSVVAGLNAITNTDGKFKFSTKVIEAMEAEANYAKIPFFNTKLGPRRIMIVHESQYRQLLADPDYRKAMDSGGQGKGWEGLSFNPFRGQWSSTLLIPTPKAWGVQGTIQNITYDTVGTYNNIPMYGPADATSSVDTLDNNDIKVAILTGPGMMTKAVGINPLSFTGEITDSGKQQTMTLNSIYAYVLSDIFDLDGKAGLTKGSWYDNNTSAVCATYSPVAVSWS